MSKNKIAVVGAGLCGTMLAVRLAQRGYEVDLYEKRPDLRKVDQDAGRSINLALSDRGLQALDMIDMRKRIKDNLIPMKGRMIHDLKGNSRFSPYSGRDNDHINSVSRSGLNADLLDKAEEYDNLRLFFDHACIRYDVNENTLQFQYQGNTMSRTYDHVFGADGAGSAIRQVFMQLGNQIRFDYQQDFLTHGYKELEFPPAENGDYRIEHHALHIWPRDEYMMIALPNLDKSFTVTLFQAFEGPQGFDSLNTDEQIRSFFESSFPDAIQHMPELLHNFRSNPTSSLGTIKCYPWYIKDKVLLMGDAAHAIVPFYGQGMNCAFEDVFILDQFIDQYEGDWQKIFTSYSETRKKDTDAIADLAIDNFEEMQDKVNDVDFIQKRELEVKLEQAYTDYFSKYSLVTFREDLPYFNAMQQGRFQDEYLLEIVRKTDQPGSLDIAKIHNDLKRLTKEKFGE